MLIDPNFSMGLEGWPTISALVFRPTNSQRTASCVFWLPDIPVQPTVATGLAFDTEFTLRREVGTVGGSGTVQLDVSLKTAVGDWTCKGSLLVDRGALGMGRSIRVPVQWEGGAHPALPTGMAGSDGFRLELGVPPATPGNSIGPAVGIVGLRFVWWASVPPVSD